MYEDDEPLENFTDQPIYQKAEEIYALVHKISQLIPNENPVLEETGNMMLADATLLTAKLAGSIGADLYDLKMENATLIRKAARDILLHCRHLQTFDFEYVAYLDLIRNEIEEFRVLFVKWVKTFDPWEYIIDEWGLFNPPGVDPDDKDPDEDL